MNKCLNWCRTSHEDSPDMVVAELGALCPVEVHGPRREVCGLRVRRAGGHLVFCPAVAGGRAGGSWEERTDRLW